MSAMRGRRRLRGGARRNEPYLIGSVAVGLIIVEGPTADLQFSEAERTKVVAEVQEGLTWLGSQEAKASVSFAYDIRTVQVDRAPNPALSGYEPLEAHWRDPAMAKIGFAANFGGVKEYVKTIRANLGTKWGYVAFFTKYPIQPLRLRDPSRGWSCTTPTTAGDPTTSTASSPTRPATSSAARTSTPRATARATRRRVPAGGQRQLPERCATATSRRASWPGNTWAMCSFTPAHLGWRDTDGDGALDPVDPVGNPNPLIDLGRLCSALPVHLPAVRAGLGARGRRRRGHGRQRGSESSVRSPVSRARGRPGRAAAPGADPAEMARVETRGPAEELRYLEALERKLRTAVDQIARERARG